MINFTKMHGLGNDFVVIDAINQHVALTAEKIKSLSDRHFGIGFDQLLLVDKALSENADFTYRIFNADGGEVSQCGNGARCFARFVQEKKLSDKNEICVDTNSGQLLLRFNKSGLITVNMGIPKHKPTEIPLLVDQESQFYTVHVNATETVFSAVSMGNPHAVIQVNAIASAAVADLGCILENHAIFPERANIGFMQILNPAHIKCRIYERGCGETQACGSGAVAAAAIGSLYHGLANEITVSLRGGDLLVHWPRQDGSIFLTGSATFVYQGVLLL